jgi:hypothetical protein
VREGAREGALTRKSIIHNYLPKAFSTRFQATHKCPASYARVQHPTGYMVQHWSLGIHPDYPVYRYSKQDYLNGCALFIEEGRQGFGVS